MIICPGALEGVSQRESFVLFYKKVVIILTSSKSLIYSRCVKVSPRTAFLSPCHIHHMRVSIGSIRRAGSWGYFAGSRKETTPNFIIILINIRENETIMFR